MNVRICEEIYDATYYKLEICFYVCMTMGVGREGGGELRAPWESESKEQKIVEAKWILNERIWFFCSQCILNYWAVYKECQ